MGYIITINSKSKQALAFLEYAKKLGFKVTKEKTALASPTTALNPQQEKFKKMLRQGLKEMKNFREKEQKELLKR